MDVTGVGSRLFDPSRLPSFGELGAVLAARPSMAEMSQRAATEVTTGQDRAADATVRAVAATGAGRVDLLL